MFPITSGATQAYLANLDKSQQQMNQIQSQMSSGIRVQQASDDPTAIAEILQLQNQIQQNTQLTTNLNTVKTELATADSSLQTAVQAVENAISLAMEGANTTVTPEQRAALAQQVAGLLQTLVDISGTQINGRYIFSGDQDTQASYQIDSTQPGGVKQLISPASTRQIVTGLGTSLSVGKTAEEIFDAKDSSGQPAAGNVFNAVNSLLIALQNNDQAGVAASLDSLKSADSYLNGQLAFYGAAENRVSAALDLAQKFQTQAESDVGRMRDADIASLATQMTQEQVQKQASLSVEATMMQTKNLFSYLG